MWDDLLVEDNPLVFEQVEFSHPLWVLFTSGTTGLPKGLAHAHGGILLEGLKWSGLYAGLREGERIFTYTSTGWALWNMQIYALPQGINMVLYEGSPNYPPGAVWEVAARTRADVMVLGAALITATANAGISPREQGHDLRRLRHMMVSGSALPPDGYRWVLEHISAGPADRLDQRRHRPVRRVRRRQRVRSVEAGRIGGRLAGVDCAAWDDDGKPVVGEVGELVVTQPMPSMPVHLWNDPDAVRYTESYFDTWPGVWRHGDWVTMHADGSISIHGRSDSTLNRQGVRLGSSDFYDVLETMPEITETLVIGLDLPDDGYWLGLFVVPAAGHALDDDLRQKIVTTLRTPTDGPSRAGRDRRGTRRAAHADRQATRGADQEVAPRDAAGEGREHRRRRQPRRAALVRAVRGGRRAPGRLGAPAPVGAEIERPNGGSRADRRHGRAHEVGPGRRPGPSRGGRRIHRPDLHRDRARRRG